MLRLTYILLFLSIFLIEGRSQPFKVSDSHIRYEGKFRTGVKIHVEVTDDVVKDYLNDFVKDKFDSNLKGYGLFTKKDEVSTEFQSMPLLTDRAVRLIGVFEERGNYTDLYFIGQWDNEEYVTKREYPDTYAKLKQIGHDFIKYFLPDYYADQVEESQDKYNDVLEEVSDLEKTIVADKEKLVELQNEIEELQVEIDRNSSELEELRNEMEDKKRLAAADKEKLEETRAALSSLEDN